MNSARYILGLLILLFSIEFSYGQLTVKKSSVDSGGAIADASGYKMIYTIGEVAVSENDSGTLHISEGFISPELFRTIGLQEYSVLKGVSLYPNPTTDLLELRFPNSENYSIEIYTISGSLLESETTESQLNKVIDISSYPSSVYVILIKNEHRKTFTSYRLIKN